MLYFIKLTTINHREIEKDESHYISDQISKREIKLG